MLLLFPLKQFNSSYLNFYFNELKTLDEKDHFMIHFSDKTITEKIQYCTKLFHEYPFYHSSIIQYANFFDDPNLITTWQRNYYADIFKEYDNKQEKRNPKIDEVYTELKSNTSFSFLVELMLELHASKNDLAVDTIIHNVLQYFYLKNNSPYYKEDHIQLENKLDELSTLIQNGQSVIDTIDPIEKKYIEKSINTFITKRRSR